MTIPQALAAALQHHQAGRLTEAEALYRQILAVQPSHAEALHLLGVAAHQAGRDDLAIEFIRQSIALHPANAAAHSNLGVSYRETGRPQEALASFRRALELKPDYAEAAYNLGNALLDHGQLDEAATAYRRALALRPDYAEASNNLGHVHRLRGELDAALAASRRALQIKPDYADALNNLGVALAEKGQWEEAGLAYRRALQLEPNSPQAHNNLGNLLKDQGQQEPAMAAYRRALELKPDYAEALNNLGTALARRGEMDEAIAAYLRALQLQPRYADACINLGNALKDAGRLDEAISRYRQALQLQPGHAEAHYNLGNAFRDRGQFDEAVAEFRRALELRPGHAEAHNNLGNTLKDQGQLDEAVAAYRRALQFQPNDAEFRSNIILALHFHPTATPGAIAGEQQRWNRQFSEPWNRFLPSYPNDRGPERRLRIGYVSPDFRDHIVGRTLLPLFRNHDARNFEIICYSGVVQPDSTTEEFRWIADHWRRTLGVADEALAAMIREDTIDILVDLSQHTAGNRLPVFARRPSPVQVSFAGYPESTGLDAIEYRISDRNLESEVEDRVFLLDSFWCYDPCGIAMPINSLPAQQSGRVTFGSLNNFCKVNEPVLQLWARVLRGVPDSRLLVLSGLGSHRERTIELLERAGVEAHRVEFVAPLPRRAYLELYHRVDVVLDTFPYNGHTTSLDALWMGVPVVSLAGQPAVSRAGLSQMSNLGLQELVAFSEDEYVRIATQLAGDLPRLAQLRSTLRSRMEASVLMDARRFARGVEAAYRAMWQRWCTGPSL